MRFYSLDVSSCSFTEVELFSTTDGTRGIAPAEDTGSDSDVYMLDGSNNEIEQVELGSSSDSGDGSRSSEVGIPTGKQRGLEYVQWQNGEEWFFVGYTTAGNSNERLKVIDETGTKDGGWSMLTDEYNPV